MARDDVQLQVVASVGTVFAIGTVEPPWTTVIVGSDMGGEIGTS